MREIKKKRRSRLPVKPQSSLVRKKVLSCEVESLSCEVESLSCEVETVLSCEEERVLSCEEERVLSCEEANLSCEVRSCESTSREVE